MEGTRCLLVHSRAICTPARRRSGFISRLDIRVASTLGVISLHKHPSTVYIYNSAFDSAAAITWFRVELCNRYNEGFVVLCISFEGGCSGDIAATKELAFSLAGFAASSYVLCSAWTDDGTTVFSGGCDKQVKMWPLLSGGQAVTVAMYDAPVKELARLPEMNLLITGIWDKTLRVVREPTNKLLDIYEGASRIKL